MRIFISHSSRDEDTARLLINLLCNALRNLNKDEILCTSVDGHRLTIGEDADETIRHAISEAQLLIGLITPSAIKSAYVLFELGGRWLIRKPMYPLLACGAELQHLQGPLTRIQTSNCSNEAEVRDFIRHTAKTLKLTPSSPATYDKEIHEFIDAASESQPTETPSSSHPPIQRHPAYDLSPLTKQLLVDASTPGGPNTGQIEISQTIAHTILETDISSHEMHNNNPAATSIWQNAIEELTTNQLIIETPSLSLGPRIHTYALTQKGFEFAHVLRPTMQ